ncbi:MAG: hypothetical protein IJP43_04805 [Oscillospiraceae bacterium]|nr:hypothetical protein [Oscillospiraceae bacterium]
MAGYYKCTGTRADEFEAEDYGMNIRIARNKAGQLVWANYGVEEALMS